MFDAPTGRVAFGASGVWASTADGDLATGRLAGEREAHRTADEGDGSGGDLLQTGDECAAAGTRDLPVFIEEQGDHGPRPSVVRRHHLHPDETRVHVSDGGDGLVEPVCAGVGIEQHAGGGVLRASVAGGAGPWKPTAADLQHRSGSTVHLRRLHWGGGGSGGAGEHGRARAVDGQPVCGTVVAEFEV